MSHSVTFLSLIVKFPLFFSELNSLSHQNLDDRISFVAADSFVKLRDKREAAEPQSAPSASSVKPSSSSSNQSPPATIDQQQQLLGVNGTGQRKDIARDGGSSSSSSSTEQPIIAANITTKLGSASLDSSHFLPPTSDEIPADEDFDKIDQTEEETNSTLVKHNITKYETVSFNKLRNVDFCVK